MNIRILLLFLISLPAFGKTPVDLKPFLTDYCTSYPEGTRQKPELWKHCCVEHDLYFWAGGSKSDRKETDVRLRECVAATGAHRQAKLIYAAVSIGANSPIRFKTKQWGHAFENRTRYLALTAEESNLVVESLARQNPDIPRELFNSFKAQLFSRLDF